GGKTLLGVVSEDRGEVVTNAGNPGINCGRDVTGAHGVVSHIDDGCCIVIVGELRQSTPCGDDRVAGQFMSCGDCGVFQLSQRFRWGGVTAQHAGVPRPVDEFVEPGCRGSLPPCCG